jgi:hypothetical protein
VTALTARFRAVVRAVGAVASDYVNDRADYALPVGGVGAVARSRGRGRRGPRKEMTRGAVARSVPETYLRRRRTRPRAPNCFAKRTAPTNWRLDHE